MKKYISLLVLIAIFGLSWPVSKLGLTHTSAANFSILRMVFAITTILTLGVLVPPLRVKLFNYKCLTPAAYFAILVLGICQIGVLISLMSMGMHYIGSGTAAIMAYTTPLLMFPISVIFLKENKFISTQGLGVLFGLSGIIVILEHASHTSLLGESLLLLVALSSGSSILYIKLSKITKEQLVAGYLLQLIIGLVFVVCLFRISKFPGTDTPLHFSLPLLLCLLFSGCLATGIGFILLSYLSSALPAALLSFSLLGVPVLGNISSSLILGEQMTLSTMLGFGLIISGLVIYLIKKPGKE